MHFVTGGAFNGKSAWVKAYYHIEEGGSWFSCYHSDSLPEDFNFVEGQIVVIEGIELWVKELLMELDAESTRAHWRRLLRNWQQWEAVQPGRLVVMIGSDITKGIVPATPEERAWRDVAGRVFQETVSVCERVDLVWYGLGQQLK